MTVGRWALVAAVAFILLVFRAEARDAVLAGSLLGGEGAEAFRPTVVQIGILVFALTAGLALLVHYLRPERTLAQRRRLAIRKNSARRPSP